MIRYKSSLGQPLAATHHILSFGPCAWKEVRKMLEKAKAVLKTLGLWGTAIVVLSEAGVKVVSLFKRKA